MKNFNPLTFFLLLILPSCGGLNFEDESHIDQALRKIDDKEKFSQIRPQWPIQDIKADLLPINQLAHQEKIPEKIKKSSSKNLYFSLLYNQYLILRSYGEKEIPDIKSCPHFHSNVVKRKELPLPSQTQQVQSNGKIKSSYTLPPSLNLGKSPELTLPLSLDEKSAPSVAEVLERKGGKNSSQLIYNAYRLYVEKNLIELNELCQNGVSSNYFIFENMVTHFKNRPDHEKNINAMPILLKTLIFSNMPLINSLEKKLGISSESVAIQFSQEMSSLQIEAIERVQAHWVLPYLEYLKN